MNEFDRSSITELFHSDEWSIDLIHWWDEIRTTPLDLSRRWHSSWIGTARRVHSLSQTTSITLLGRYSFASNTEKLCWVKYKEICAGLLCNPRLRMWIGCLADGYDPLCLFTQIRVSLYARAWLFSLANIFHSILFILLLRKQYTLQFLFYIGEFLSILLQIRVIWW